MLIIDSQIHLWDSGQPPPHHRQTPHLAEVALDDMNAAGVTAAINSPPPFDVNSRYAIESARRFPDRFATTGSLDLSRAEAPDLVRRWRSQPGMIGFRFLCGLEDERSWPTDGTMDWFLPLAQELGLPVALGGPFVLPHVERWAAQYPDLKLTIDHFGIVGLTPSRGLIQHDDLLSWSRFPNVSVKMSGAPDYAREDEYPFKSMHDTIRLLYDAYGPERLFWGTDITRLDNCTWRQAVTMFTEELPWLSDTDKTLIMGEALCRWFNWWPSLPPAARPEGAGR